MMTWHGLRSSVNGDSTTRLSQLQLNPALLSCASSPKLDLKGVSLWWATKSCNAILGVMLNAKIPSISPASKLRMMVFFFKVFCYEVANYLFLNE